MDKLTPLSLFLDRQLGDNDSPLQKFIIDRDQAYFKTAFFSGDRPGDLGQVKVPEIFRFPNDNGFLFNHIRGKPLRDGDNNVFGIRRNPQMTFCPIRGIEHYLDVDGRSKSILLVVIYSVQRHPRVVFWTPPFLRRLQRTGLNCI